MSPSVWAGNRAEPSEFSAGSQAETRQNEGVSRVVEQGATRSEPSVGGQSTGIGQAQPQLVPMRGQADGVSGQTFQSQKELQYRATQPLGMAGGSNSWQSSSKKSPQYHKMGSRLPHVFTREHFNQRLANDKAKWDSMMMERVQEELSRKYISYEEQIHQLQLQRDSLVQTYELEKDNLATYKSQIIRQLQTLESKVLEQPARYYIPVSDVAENESRLLDLQKHLCDLLKENQDLVSQTEMRNSGKHTSVNQASSDFENLEPAEENSVSKQYAAVQERKFGADNQVKFSQNRSQLTQMMGPRESIPETRDLDHRTNRIHQVLKAMEVERLELHKEIQLSLQKSAPPVRHFAVTSPPEGSANVNLSLNELQQDNDGLRIHLREAKSHLDQKHDLFIETLATLISKLSTLGPGSPPLNLTNPSENMLLPQSDSNAAQQYPGKSFFSDKPSHLPIESLQTYNPELHQKWLKLTALRLQNEDLDRTLSNHHKNLNQLIAFASEPL